MADRRFPASDRNLKKATIGIPRALLYNRSRILWSTFFHELELKTIFSSPTNRQTQEKGSERAIDEMCLSVKIYLGHVQELIGKCDYILVPRIVSYGIRRTMCTTFEALPDIVRNIFWQESPHILTYNVDLEHSLPEEQALTRMGISLGFLPGQARRAAKRALAAQKKADERQAKETEQLYKESGLRVAVAAHSYVLEDDYIGKPVADYLKKMGVTVIRADQVDRKAALDISAKVSPTLKWELSREIVGSLWMHRSRLDGIILMSVYPCALDSMVNDMIVRKFEGSGIPILQLTMDAQSGTAGVETRLESFIDIIRMRETAQREQERQREQKKQDERDQKEQDKLAARQRKELERQEKDERKQAQRRRKDEEKREKEQAKRAARERKAGERAARGKKETPQGSGEEAH